MPNTLTADFSIDALEEALSRYGTPGIFNTDQGSQFSSLAFIAVLKAKDIRISMDSKGCWRDNVFIEYLWKIIKYEKVYLHAYGSVSEPKISLGKYINFYNQRQPHQANGRVPPDHRYYESLPQIVAAQTAGAPRLDQLNRVRKTGSTSLCG